MIKNKVWNNAAWILSGRAVQAVLGLAISMLSARYLGPSNFGVINYAASVVAFVVPVMHLGLNAVLVRELIAEPTREGETLGTAMMLSFISAFLCVGGVTAFSAIANAGERETVLVCLLYSLLLVAQSVELIQYWFQAKFLSKYTTVVVLIAYILVSAYRAFLIISGKSIYWFAVSQAIDHMLIAGALMVIYHRLGGDSLRFSWERAKQMFCRSRYYIISDMMVTVFAQIDKIMIKLMLGNTQVGYYSAAVACAGMTSAFFAAVIDSFRPAVLEYKNDDQQKFERSVSQLHCVIVYISLLQSVLMTLLAGPIMQLLYGEAYQPAVDTLRLVVWYTTFSYMGSVRNVWILAEGKQKYLWIINLSGAILNVLLNLLLIPLMGVNGAALASLLTQFFTNVVLGFIMSPIREHNRLMLNGLNPRTLISAVRKNHGE